MCSEIKTAIRSRVAAWQAEGDKLSVREMLSDAFEHLRWQIEKHGNLEAALSAIMRACQ